MTSAILAMRYMIQLAGIIQETNTGADRDMADGNVQVFFAQAKQAVTHLFHRFGHPAK
jgi:hypothetical protein